MELSRDGWVLFATCAVRSFAYGFLSVVLGLYLDAIGLDTTAIGWIFTAALAGGAVMTIVLTAVADTFGRRSLLVLGAVLMALAGLAFVATNNPILLAAAANLRNHQPLGKGGWALSFNRTGNPPPNNSRPEPNRRLSPCPPTRRGCASG